MVLIFPFKKDLSKKYRDLENVVWTASKCAAGEGQQECSHPTKRVFFLHAASVMKNAAATACPTRNRWIAQLYVIFRFQYTDL